MIIPTLPANKKRYFRVALYVIACAVLLLLVQVIYLVGRHGLNYIHTKQLSKHNAILDGTAIEPYRYRILSAWVISGIMTVTRGEFVTVALSLRLVQNVAVFALLFRYLKSFDISTRRSAAGVALFCFGLLFSFYQSDLSFYNYFELIFFLLAALLVRGGQARWIVPVTVLATLNRETCVLIPLILFAFDPRQYRIAFLTLVAALGTYGAIRLMVGPAEYSGSGFGAVYPGWQLFLLNMQDRRAWLQLFGMYHVLPLAFLFRLPAHFYRLLILLAAPWFALQFWFGTANEGRLFLVPLALVFIPSALCLFPAHQIDITSLISRKLVGVEKYLSGS